MVALDVIPNERIAMRGGDPAATGPRDIAAVKTLRISVTDRCNFRCVYCMPEHKLDWVPREEILKFEEIVAVARAAQRHGINAFKLTGGEPLVRYDLARLIGMLKALPGAPELSMTTNGALLGVFAGQLRDNGLDRITVSLDTLRPDRFSKITRGARIEAVLRGIEAAVEAGFHHPKINCVVMRGINDDELADFAALTFDRPLTVRFIEYMPLGRTALGGEYEHRFISECEIRQRIEAVHSKLSGVTKDTGHGPAVVHQIRGARGRIGFISAMSKPFCSTCNRLRLTAEGQLRSCLFDGGEVELRPILRDRADANDSALPGHTESGAQRALHHAFIRCVAYKPEVHSYFGNRQMSQLGG
ncbi:MAG: GTP 3',8-cyclase MoaA [Phycisphaerae bacterium]|nr:GTP 3',8-cyclase MoaA [Phycisphaerae bacterium]